MQIRTLNDEGLAEFKAFLSALRSDSSLEAPLHLLSDGNYSEPFDSVVEVESLLFPDSYSLGLYLVEKLAPCEDRLISRDAGLWNWLSILYFDSICKRSDSGQRKILEDAVYFLDSAFSFRKYYRHAVRTPWLAVKEHGIYSKVLLLTAGRGVRSDVSEQLGAHQDICSNRMIIEAAYRLYFDEVAGRMKVGLGKKGGSPRRLASIVRQLELTYDLRDCDVSGFSALLPKEFDRWSSLRVG